MDLQALLTNKELLVKLSKEYELLKKSGAHVNYDDWIKQRLRQAVIETGAGVALPSSSPPVAVSAPAPLASAQALHPADQLQFSSRQARDAPGFIVIQPQQPVLLPAASPHAAGWAGAGAVEGVVLMGQGQPDTELQAMHRADVPFKQVDVRTSVPLNRPALPPRKGPARPRAAQQPSSGVQGASARRQQPEAYVHPYRPGQENVQGAPYTTTTLAAANGAAAPSHMDPAAAAAAAGPGAAALAGRPDWVNAASLQAALVSGGPVVTHLRAAAERDRRLAASAAVARQHVELGLPPGGLAGGAAGNAAGGSGGGGANEGGGGVLKAEVQQVLAVATQLMRQNEDLTKAVQETGERLKQQEALLNVALGRGNDTTAQPAITAAAEAQPGSAADGASGAAGDAAAGAWFVRALQGQREPPQQQQQHPDARRRARKEELKAMLRTMVGRGAASVATGSGGGTQPLPGPPGGGNPLNQRQAGGGQQQQPQPPQGGGSYEQETRSKQRAMSDVERLFGAFRQLHLPGGMWDAPRQPGNPLMGFSSRDQIRALQRQYLAQRNAAAVAGAGPAAHEYVDKQGAAHEPRWQQQPQQHLESTDEAAAQSYEQQQQQQQQQRRGQQQGRQTWESTDDENSPQQHQQQQRRQGGRPAWDDRPGRPLDPPKSRNSSRPASRQGLPAAARRGMGYSQPSSAAADQAMLDEVQAIVARDAAAAEEQARLDRIQALEERMFGLADRLAAQLDRTSELHQQAQAQQQQPQARSGQAAAPPAASGPTPALLARGAGPAGQQQQQQADEAQPELGLVDLHLMMAQLQRMEEKENAIRRRWLSSPGSSTYPSTDPAATVAAVAAATTTAPQAPASAKGVATAAPAGSAGASSSLSGATRDPLVVADGLLGVLPRAEQPWEDVPSRGAALSTGAAAEAVAVHARVSPAQPAAATAAPAATAQAAASGALISTREAVDAELVSRVLSARRAFLAHQRRRDGDLMAAAGVDHVEVVEDITDMLIEELIARQADEMAGLCDAMGEQLFDGEFADPADDQGMS